MLADLTRRRLEAKAESRRAKDEAERAMWEGIQGSFKVLINSFYGYLGYGGGLFNDYDAAEQVTLAGQRIVKQIVASLEQHGATPIEVDTDGVYFVPPDGVATREEEQTFIDTCRQPTCRRASGSATMAATPGCSHFKLKTYALLDDPGRDDAERECATQPAYGALLP